MNLEWLKPIAPHLFDGGNNVRSVKHDELGMPLPMVRLLVLANLLIGGFFAYTYVIGNHPLAFTLTVGGLLANVVLFYLFGRRASLNRERIAIAQVIFIVPLAITVFFL